MQRVEQHWLLLQRLAIAACSGDKEQNFVTDVQNNYLTGNLIPSTACMQWILLQFSCPLL